MIVTSDYLNKKKDKEIEREEERRNRKYHVVGYGDQKRYGSTVVIREEIECLKDR